MRALRDEARNMADRIQVFEFSPAVELVLDASGCSAGAVLDGCRRVPRSPLHHCWTRHLVCGNRYAAWQTGLLIPSGTQPGMLAPCGGAGPN
jgi:hypothetical protein